MGRRAMRKSAGRGARSASTPGEMESVEIAREKNEGAGRWRKRESQVKGLGEGERGSRRFGSTTEITNCYYISWVVKHE